MDFKISAYFRLSGQNLEPEDITALVGVIPTNSWRTGDLIDPRLKKRRKYNAWIVESQLDKSAELDEHIKAVFEKLQPGWESLVKISPQFDTFICGVIYAYSYIPAINFDKYIIQKAGELNAGIDVDLYSFLENEKGNSVDNMQ